MSSCGPTLGFSNGWRLQPPTCTPETALSPPAPQSSRTWPKRPAQRPHLSARPPRGRSCWSKPASPAHNLSWSAPRGHNGATKQPSGAVGQTKPARATSGSTGFVAAAWHGPPGHRSSQLGSQRSPLGLAHVHHLPVAAWNAEQGSSTRRQLVGASSCRSAPSRPPSPLTAAKRAERSAPGRGHAIRI